MVDLLLEFANMGAFNQFETAQKINRGIPFKGRGKSDGQLKPNKGGTDNYAEAIPHPTPQDNRVLAFVGDDVDVSGLNVVTLAEAKAQGWFSEDDLV